MLKRPLPNEVLGTEGADFWKIKSSTDGSWSFFLFFDTLITSQSYHQEATIEFLGSASGEFQTHVVCRQMNQINSFPDVFLDLENTFSSPIPA